MAGVKLQNWKRSITYHADSVQIVTSADAIAASIADRDKFPAPIRVMRSFYTNHFHKRFE